MPKAEEMIVNLRKIYLTEVKNTEKREDADLFLDALDDYITKLEEKNKCLKKELTLNG